MSTVDDLKNGIVIDTLNGDDGSTDNSSDNDGLVIDSINGTTTNSTPTPIKLSGLSKKGNHQVILPKDKPTKASGEPTAKRVITSRPQVDISSIAKEDPVEEKDTIKESLQKDILDINNPNSILSKYIENETKEMKEWAEEKNTEAELLKEEMETEAQLDEIEAETDSDDRSLVLDIAENNNQNIEYDTMEDEDISSLFDEEKEDNKVDKKELETTEDLIPEEDIDDIEEEEEDYDEVDEEDAALEENEPTDSEWDEDEVDSEEVTSNATEEAKSTEPEEPERYDAPEGIDVDVETGDDTLATEIIEEDETEIVKDNVDTDATLRHLQKLATEKLKPISKSLDISSFTILKKPVTSTKSIFEDQKARVAKWVLPNQKSIVLMKEFSGAELEKLREYSENNRSIDSLNRRYHMIYDHITSPKPATFEQWLKTTPYEDVDNYFFCIYIASFKGANYLPADCINPDCKETFLSDNIPIMDMVKFESKKAQADFAELYQSEAMTAGKGVYCSEVVPLNNKVAVAFREPSIYNVFEIAGLDDSSRRKYSEILDYIPYIDTVYMIDQVNQQLVPITYKMYPDNPNRTVRSKIQKYSNIFNSLSVDEFGVIKAYVRAIADKTQDMYYVYPAISCPKCGNTTEETRTTAEELVFTRYQLGSLVTTSLS